MDGGEAQSSTPFWKSVQSVLKQPKNNVIWTVGNGKSIGFGIDPWCPGCPNFIPRFIPRYQQLSSSHVDTMSYKDKWKTAKMKQLFMQEDARVILAMPPPREK